MAARGEGNAKAEDQAGGVQRIRIEQHSFSGMLWFAGWLFTIGYAQLPLVQGIFALVLWPYYLGTTLEAGGVAASDVAP